MAAGDADKDGSDKSNPMAALQWQIGPGTDTIASKATLNVPADVVYIDEANSTKFLELSGNIPHPGNFIVASKKDNWWATFSFNPIGYVKDDEKIDADDLLKTMKDSDGPANEERRKRGIPELVTDGWTVAPHYDSATKRLEWGLKLHSPKNVAVNYTIRFLGRTGVMNATLVTSPETLDADVKSFKAVLNGFDFNSGERYAEFRAGDHVAEIGLGALVLGGAAAVAAKKGFFTVIFGFLAAAWKFIAVAFVGLLAKIRSLFSKKQE
jgi:uncharacterized membrane-anchored protein